MLTDEERTKILSIHAGGSLYDLSIAIERAVLAKAGGQEPVGFIDAEGEPHLSVDGLKGGYLYIGEAPLPAQSDNPLVEAVFAASDKKATDTFGKCPRCSHECSQAIPDKETIEAAIVEAHKKGWNDCISHIDAMLSASPKP